ncbi:MAG: hypothetical protein WA109_09310, partial [Bellilinea sp.]
MTPSKNVNSLQPSDAGGVGNISDNQQKWIELNLRITACRLCPRLVAYREEIARAKKRAFRDWEYWGKP